MLSSERNIFNNSTTLSKSLNFLHNYQEFISNTNGLLQHLLSWRKNKRSKDNTSNNTSNVQPVCDDVCVIMKSDNITRVFPVNNQDCLTQGSSIPMVNFINKNDKLISSQTMNRVLLNENELYSLSVSKLLSQSSQNFHSTSNNSDKKPDMLSLSSNTPIPPERNDSLYNCENQLPHWFHKTIDRQTTINLLNNSSIGTFIVRYSTTKPSCYALSIRVPQEFHPSGIAHYLIIRTMRDTLKIKGFTKEFNSLESLIIHHSIIKEFLPCTLTEPYKQNCILINSTEHHNQSCSIKNDEELVDVDTDPDYRRIITHFRKTMSKCK